jgi:hypothetical protein
MDIEVDRTPSSGPTVILVAALAAGVVAQGGYYPTGRVLLTAIVAVAVAVTPGVWRQAATGRSPATWRRPATGRWPVLPEAAALAAWILGRAVAAGAYREAVGAVATVGVVVAVLAVLRHTGSIEREWCAEAAVALGLLVALSAWIGVAWRLPRFAILVEGKVWRGSSTLTYPNAAAAVLGPLALLALALFVARPRSAIRLTAGYLLLVGVGATFSRAAILAVGVGLVVLAAGVGWRAAVRHVPAPLLGAVVAVGALAPSIPVHASPRPSLAVAGLLAGWVVALVGLLPPRLRPVSLTVAAGVAVMIGIYGLPTGSLRAVLASRGNLDSSGRTRGGMAALEMVARHPLAGNGIGRSWLWWTTPAGNGAVARYAHNEYLQILVDLGIVGLALLIWLLVTIALAVHRGRLTVQRPGLRAGCVAGLAALAVHSGFDFLWHIAVIPLLASLLIGLAGPVHRQEPTNSSILEET